MGQDTALQMILQPKQQQSSCIKKCYVFQTDPLAISRGGTGEIVPEASVALLEKISEGRLYQYDSSIAVFSERIPDGESVFISGFPRDLGGSLAKDFGFVLHEIAYVS